MEDDELYLKVFEEMSQNLEKFTEEARNKIDKEDPAFRDFLFGLQAMLGNEAVLGAIIAYEVMTREQ